MAWGGTFTHPISNFNIFYLLGNDGHNSSKKSTIKKHCNENNEDWGQRRSPKLIMVLRALRLSAMIRAFRHRCVWVKLWTLNWFHFETFSIFSIFKWRKMKKLIEIANCLIDVLVSSEKIEIVKCLQLRDPSLRYGYINVGDGCWWQMLVTKWLRTTLRCWILMPFSNIVRRDN